MRQVNYKYCSNTGLAFYFDASVVPLDDLFAYGKPEARAGNA